MDGGLELGDKNLVTFGDKELNKQKLDLTDLRYKIDFWGIMSKAEIFLKGVPVSEKTQRGVLIAQEKINRMRAKLGMKEKRPEDFLVVFVTEDSFRELSGIGKIGECPKGMVLGPGHTPVVVVDDEEPPYMDVVAAFHELMHVDLETVVVSAKSDDGGEPVFGELRTGLLIGQRRVENGVEIMVKSGQLVNEMANYVYHYEFQRELLETEPFKEENGVRESAIRGKYGDGEFTKIKIKSNVDIYIRPRYFDEVKPGIIDEGGYQPLILQLYENISEVLKYKYGNDVNFAEMLLLSKLDFKKISVWATMISETFGRRFYNKLRNAGVEYDVKDMKQMELLLRMSQNKLKNIKPEHYGHT